jgi:hypothetical protein
VYVAWYKQVIASIVYSQLIVHGQRLSRYMNDVGSSPLSTTWWLVVRFATHDVHAQRTAATHNVRDMSLHMLGARCRVFIAQARTFLSKPKLSCPSGASDCRYTPAAMATVFADPDDNGNYTRWYVPSCPLSHECSASSWAKTEK